jgi:hypothetical protein
MPLEHTFCFECGRRLVVATQGTDKGFMGSKGGRVTRRVCPGCYETPEQCRCLAVEEEGVQDAA